MILDSTVNASWNNAIKKWYVNKGYLFTKNKDEFTVKLEDLIPTSTIKVNVKCDYCGEEHKKEYRKYISGRKVVEKDCCSNKKCYESYGLGICLHPKIHSLFHIEYGKTGTINDFNSFKNDYINGLYKNKIDIDEVS